MDILHLWNKFHMISQQLCKPTDITICRLYAGPDSNAVDFEGSFLALLGSDTRYYAIE